VGCRVGCRDQPAEIERNWLVVAKPVAREVGHHPARLLKDQFGNRKIPFGSHSLVSAGPHTEHDIDCPWVQKHARREPGDGRFLEHCTETVGDAIDDGGIAGCAKPL